MKIDESTIYSIVEKAKKYDELLKIQQKSVLHCSFCGTGQNDVEKLVAGHNVYICNECVEACVEALNYSENHGINHNQEKGDSND